MKIAQIAPITERVPPKTYGGTERVVHALTQELVKRGHEVTLFASGDSLTSASLVSVYPKSLRESKIKDLYGFNMWTLMNIGVAYERAEEFDIIHDHNGHISLPTANMCTVTPVVMTMHGAFNSENTRIFETLKNPHVVSISKSQVQGLPPINHVGNVYNGLDMQEYPFSDTHDGYLLYVGRICLEKGVRHAIEVAQLLHLPLIIAAKLEPSDMTYFKEYIEPYLSDRITWIGEVNEQKRNELMSRAMCFLHPVRWKEPFGLTLIESGACGCPVIAFGKGSIPEVIANEKNGYVVNDTEEMVEAVKKIALINRAECRKYVLDTFSATVMADGYERIYRELLTEKNNLRMYLTEKEVDNHAT